MVLAAAITFLFLGFSPFRLAKKGLLISLAFVIGVSAPLIFGFLRIVRENEIVESFEELQLRDMVFRNVEVRQVDPLRISVQIISERPLTEEELREVKGEIEEHLGEDVELEISIGIRM